MENFKEALEDCGLSDLGFQGDIFTWRNNSHEAEGYIRERLDRAVANTSWKVKFPVWKVINDEQRHSDHRPVIILTEKPPWRQKKQGESEDFKFEAKWLLKQDCEKIVLEGWEEARCTGGGVVQERLKKVAAKLKYWNSNVLGDLDKRIKKAKDELEACRRNQLSPQNIAKEGVLKFKLERLEDQCDMYWR